MSRLATTKTSLYEDIKNVRFFLRRAEQAIANGEWYEYIGTMEQIEALCSASRWAADDNYAQEGI